MLFLCCVLEAHRNADLDRQHNLAQELNSRENGIDDCPLLHPLGDSVRHNSARPPTKTGPKRSGEVLLKDRCRLLPGYRHDGHDYAGQDAYHDGC